MSTPTSKANQLHSLAAGLEAAALELRILADAIMPGQVADDPPAWHQAWAEAASAYKLQRDQPRRSCPDSL